MGFALQLLAVLQTQGAARIAGRLRLWLCGAIVPNPSIVSDILYPLFLNSKSDGLFEISVKLTLKAAVDTGFALFEKVEYAAAYCKNSHI